METKMPALMNYCSHSHSSEGEGAPPRWGCLQGVVPTRILRGQKGHRIKHQNMFYLGFACTAAHNKFEGVIFQLASPQRGTRNNADN